MYEWVDAERHYKKIFCPIFPISIQVMDQEILYPSYEAWKLKPSRIKYKILKLNGLYGPPTRRKEESRRIMYSITLYISTLTNGYLLHICRVHPATQINCLAEMYSVFIPKNSFLILRHISTINYHTSKIKTNLVFPCKFPFLSVFSLFKQPWSVSDPDPYHLPDPDLSWYDDINPFMDPASKNQTKSWECSFVLNLFFFFNYVFFSEIYRIILRFLEIVSGSKEKSFKKFTKFNMLFSVSICMFICCLLCLSVCLSVV